MRSIPDNLTYEQFKAYAERQPSLEGDWLYRLQHKKPCQPLAGPEFGLCRDEYMFQTFKDAEKYISELVMACNGETWCFNIQQIPSGGNPSKQGAEWLYDRNGNLVDYTNTIWDDDNSIESTFFGRPDSRIRFHKGDIVLVEERGMVHPVVIAAEGPTIDRFWKLYNIRKERRKDRFDYPSDASDDCYYVINGPGEIYHAHISPTAIMPYNGTVPHDIKAYFTRCLKYVSTVNSKNLL